jgi:hypothetical protein
LLYAFKAARRPYQAPAGPDSLGATLAITSVVGGTPVLLSATADDTRYNNRNGGEPVQPTAAARYSLDAPAWITGTAVYQMAAADGSFDSAIEEVRAEVHTGQLGIGRHTLYVESQDSAGNWGAPSAVFLWVMSVSPHLELDPAALDQPINPGDTVTRTLAIANSGSGPLHWQIDAQPARAWLSVTPAAGAILTGNTSPVAVTFAVDADLPVGVYTGTLRVSSDDPSRPAADLPLTMTVTSACLPVSYLSFTYTPSPAIGGRAVTFVANAAGTKPIVYGWDFGDGSPGATGQTAQHAFPPSVYGQDYPVALSVRNACPSSLAAQSPVHVQPHRVFAPLIPRQN